ncbi:hypothetical protein WA158_006306 [Blastocystis sp. Blastoise]
MSDLMEYNGGAVLAMKGKECIAIACDLRLGAQYETVDMNFKKVYQMGDHLFVGFSGLATDAQTFSQVLKYEVNLYKLREHRDISPKAFTALIQDKLYAKRFAPYFIEPVIAGLDKDNIPYLNSLDTSGAGMNETSYAVAGTCTDNMLGTCEALYKEDMNPEELFEVISQVLLASVDRDAYSGWGAIVWIITKDQIIERKLKTRMD